MAIATKALPDTSTLVLTYSDVFANFQDFTRKINPKNSDGTNYDCTSLTSVQLSIRNSSAAPFAKNVQPNASSSSPGATGFTVTVAKGDLGDILDTFSSPSGLLYALIGSDGTNYCVLAQGSLTISAGA